MTTLFYAAATVAIVATALALTRSNVVHGLLYLTVSLLAVAMIFFLAGAPLIAALEVIIYAGAIMVLFVFAVMLLVIGRESEVAERLRLRGRVWAGPLVLAGLLAAELLYVLIVHGAPAALAGAEIDAQRVGLDLFGRYALAVEMASMLLLAGAVGAYHLGRRTPPLVRPIGRTPERDA